MSWQKLTAGVSTRANLISYFNGNHDAPDTWIAYDGSIEGAVNATWTKAYYRFVSSKTIEITLKCTMTGAVTGAITVGPPPGMSFDLNHWDIGGTALAYRDGVTHMATMVQNGTTLAIYGSGVWNATVPFTWQTNDILVINVRIPVTLA